MQSPSKGCAGGCDKEGTGSRLGLADGAAGLAASSTRKALGKAKMEPKLLRVQVKPRCPLAFSHVPAQHPPCCCTSQTNAGCAAW